MYFLSAYSNTDMILSGLRLMAYGKPNISRNIYSIGMESFENGRCCDPSVRQDGSVNSLVMEPFERPDWDEYFMIQAELAKLRSNCMAKQVGAVIAKNHRQLATGYNGTPSGVKNCCEGGCERCFQRVKNGIKSGQQLDRCLCVHAEANAIMHCAILGISTTRGSTLYSTVCPCLECTKMAVTIGVKRIVYTDEYSESAQSLVDSAGIEVIRMEKSRINRWIDLLASTHREE